MVLVVSIGIDTTDALKNAKAADAAVKKTSDNIAASAKRIEESQKRAADSFNTVKNQALSLFAVLAGAHSVEQFIEQTTRADAALGRLANTLGMSANGLGAWQNIGRLFGGSGDDVGGAFRSMSDSLQSFLHLGQMMPMAFYQAQAAGGKFVDTTKGAEVALLGFADNLEKIATSDPVYANWLARQVTGNEAMANILVKGRKAISEMVAEQRKLAPTQADVDAANARQKAWAELELRFEKIGRTILTDLTPALLEAARGVERWVEENKEWLTQDLEARLKSLAGWIKSFATTVDAIVVGMGGWQNATEILFGLWVGKQFIAVLANIAAIKTAFLGAAGAGSGLFRLLGGAGAIAAGALAESTPNSDPTAQQRAQARSDEAAYAAAHGGYWHPLNDAVNWLTGGRARVAAAPNGWQSDAVSKFMGMGWSRAQAIGIAANLQSESGGRIGAVGDNGSAYGLGQWHGDRQQAFANWAGHGIRSSTMDEQLAFVDYELRHNEQKAGRMLAAATNAAQAAAIVSSAYERPANAQGEAWSRAGLAASWESRLPAPASSSNDNSHRTINVAVGGVHTQATDAHGIAGSIDQALKDRFLAFQLDTGPQ